MSFDILNPNATVTIALEGLAVCCFNKSHDNNRGRWEVAIPRFKDHKLKITIAGLGAFIVGDAVKFIEIKDREGVATKPKHEVGTFNRKEPDKNDKNDLRWVRDFTNSEELPHTNVRPITKAQNPNRVDVTMLYVYDAIFYTKRVELDPVKIIRSEQKDTIPVDGDVLGASLSTVGSVLDKIDEFGTEAKTLGMDVQSPRGGTVDIIFNMVVATAIPQGTKPQEILIENLEEAKEADDDRFVITDKSAYGLGDFYRYYQLFEVDGPRFHLWGKLPPDDESNRSCCCNKVMVDLDNLDAFLND